MDNFLAEQAKKPAPLPTMHLSKQLPSCTLVFQGSSVLESSTSPGRVDKSHGDFTCFVLRVWMASSHFFLLLSSSSRRSSSKAFCQGDRALYHHVGTSICQPHASLHQERTDSCSCLMNTHTYRLMSPLAGRDLSTLGLLSATQTHEGCFWWQLCKFTGNHCLVLSPRSTTHTSLICDFPCSAEGRT